jgi:hypothetical protein
MKSSPAKVQRRGLDRPTLDRAYNNAAAVPTSAGIVAGWERRSAALRERTCVDQLKWMVAKGGIEPPTQGFSVLCSTN